MRTCPSILPIDTARNEAVSVPCLNAADPPQRSGNAKVAGYYVGETWAGLGRCDQH